MPLGACVTPSSHDFCPVLCFAPHTQSTSFAQSRLAGGRTFPAQPALDLSFPTEVVVLANMVTADELANPTEMGEILEDTKLECAKYGAVLRCASPKPGSGGPPGSEISSDRISGCVFVKFDSIEAAVACAQELHGKMFDKRAVSVSFISISTFDAMCMLPCHIV